MYKHLSLRLKALNDKKKPTVNINIDDDDDDYFFLLTLLKLVDMWLFKTPLLGLMFSEGSLLPPEWNVRKESDFVSAFVSVSVKDSCLSTTVLQNSNKCLYIVRNSSKLIPVEKK